MLTCETAGHLWGPLGKCVMCGAPDPKGNQERGGLMEARSEWRNRHGITDWEFGQIGRLLCDHDARDLARMVVRLEGQLEVAKQLAETSPNPDAIDVQVWIARWTEAQRQVELLRKDTWILMSAVRGHTPDLNTQTFDEVIGTQKIIDAAVKRAQTSLQEAHARKSGTAPSGAVSHDAPAERGPEPAL